MTAPSSPRSPGERPALRSVLPLPLVTALLTATATGAAVAVAPQSVRTPLAAGAGAAALLLTAVVAVAVHARVSVRLLRLRLNAVSQETGLLLQERARTAEEFAQERGRLTEEFVQERARIAAEFARERVRLTTESERERERLSDERDRTAEEITQERVALSERAKQAETERSAVLAVTANVAGRMQALATATLADLRAMEERHADEDVLADLLHLDHRTAQAGRLADSVAVLAGARSGRRWARPIPMESILRGAMGRIGAYRRVRLHSSSETAVAGHAAEGVMHALAELLDNAANFSPPTAEVHVYVEEVPAGAIISVEDSGLVMGDVQLRRAERAVSGEATDLASLSGTRLGLAVVGRLARKHGLRISFRPSARGGTGVLMLIPQDVLASTMPTTASPTGSAPAQSPYGGARAPHDLDAEPTPIHSFPSDAPAAPVADPVADALIDSLSGYRNATPAPDPAPAPAPGNPAGAPAFGSSYDGSSGYSSDYSSGSSQDTSHDSSYDPSYGSPIGTSGSAFGSSFRSSFSSEFGTGEYEFGSGDETAAAPSEALPRRRRGQSLADAEARTRAAADAAAARPERTSRPAEDASSGAVRFSSFRRAVRGTSGGLDQAFVQGTAAGDEGATGVPPGTGAALEPVRDAAAPAEAVRQPELEPVRESEWGAVAGSAWEPGPEPVRETDWEPGPPVQESAWVPEPARGLVWEPEAVKEAAWQAEAAAELPWAPDPAGEAKWELDPVRELAWEPARDTRPAPDEDTGSASYPSPSYPDPDPDPDPAGERLPAPDPRTHPHLEGDHTP
ncbi:sensor histidine kinase [Streptomyces stelliscabiei]|uniref:sensor histidine kinase n=1 Tax=Streptomyces stelliscabiei TaxID=146820 RepID=UPI0029AEF70D|nr:ATP-binding protein [Streptomyces stelliscabiei]MDX2555849.1 ATP-binding protein [Streptomyces stelliscabiei]MDX2616454.1 ATP-binding protein [Streptomyces stelliscabiei]MDX2641272.1 ATP-binding protein [Streptomyces stelliscabiei]MDX2667831.1 ATP-binding protein [Streptomyces stelliscabiei]MDX2716465.1 ATP-binding protein [Streptomyces stelliscabiei]